jgi:hypothetical protein
MNDEAFTWRPAGPTHWTGSVSDRIIQLADDFWNIRGSFRVLGLVDTGTQMSLVRLGSGAFVLLDSYTLAGDVEQRVLEVTDHGRKIAAIINLHPFHTTHVRAVAAAFPAARLFGTSRHVAREPDLPWEATHTEDPAFGELFADDFHFTVPQGVDFVAKNRLLHFSSVLAFHGASRTLHVDDTLVYMPIPFVGGLRFHQSLGRVLQPRAGAAAAFRRWAAELRHRSEAIEHLCTAHMRRLPPTAADGEPVAEQVAKALAKAEKTLVEHEARFG